jgi:hypothetical protein
MKADSLSDILWSTLTLVESIFAGREYAPTKVERPLGLPAVVSTSLPVGTGKAFNIGCIAAGALERTALDGTYCVDAAVG